MYVCVYDSSAYTCVCVKIRLHWKRVATLGCTLVDKRAIVIDNHSYIGFCTRERERERERKKREYERESHIGFYTS